MPRITSPGATPSFFHIEPSPATSYKLPSLDSYQQQASAQYWPGATSSTGAGPAPTAQVSTLPTPPTDNAESADGYKPPAPRSDFPNLADATSQQPGMHSDVEHTGAPTSLTQRRPAASNLPNFELPAPFNQQFQQRYNFQNRDTIQQTTNIGGGNLLTPPSTVPSDNLSPLSSILNGVNASMSNPNVHPGAPNHYNYGWPPLPTGLTPNPMSSGTPQPAWSAPLPTRGLFSPSLAASLPRGDPDSPTAGDSLPPPPYDMNNLPPLPTSMTMAGGNLAALATAQQQPTMQTYMNQTQNQAQTPISATATQPSPGGGIDSYTQRPQSTPSAFYSHSQPSSAQQSNFPPFSHSSPVQQSPMSAPPQGSRMSPMSSHSATFPPPTSQYPYGRVSYAPYLPAMSAPAQLGGPVLSNIHNPGNPMGMMGMPTHGLPGGIIPPGYHSGHVAQLTHQLYGPPPTAHNERPFKCDQCPQSFNRNHDLKRHKRIHLAVKPFPCGHCDKSFSRKDALKVKCTYPLGSISC